MKMPPIRAEGAEQGHDREGCFFLPWALPGIVVSWVFADQGQWGRAPGGRRWSSLATAEQPRTAQGRPSFGALANLAVSPLA